MTEDEEENGVRDLAKVMAYERIIEIAKRLLLDEVKDMQTWPDDIRKRHGIKVAAHNADDRGG